MKKYFIIVLAVFFINAGWTANRMGEYTSAFEQEIVGNRCRNLICDVMISDYPLGITTPYPVQCWVCRKCFKHYMIHPNVPEIRIKDEYENNKRSRIVEIYTGIIEKSYFCFNPHSYHEQKNLKLLAQIWKEAPPKGKHWAIDLEFMWEAARKLDSSNFDFSLPFEEEKIEKDESTQERITFKFKSSKNCTIS